MIGLLIAASLSAAVPAEPAAASASTEARATRPALFEVRDADTTIYIFGTFHALDGNGDWFSGNVRGAFDSAQELVLETILPEPRAEASNQSTMPISYAANASPFLASTRLALSAARGRGMNPAKGADVTLRAIAERQGKGVAGLESFDSQLRMFSRMPGATNASGTAPSAALPVTMRDLESAWKRGDQALFVHTLDQLRTGAPEMYRVMFTERNARWAEWIEARLRTPGTVFVAVGAGHLAGQDSLLVRLAERGIESRRLN